ncbi:glutamine ABC transporter substrate-binding protein [Brevirhabdus pacifica]|uniref:Glutamine ABC transporter substrate-binding protein n=2 Tax=Brevirhabdus pacifica TaxID=1267768 RepID=A0A1U7DM56_9RHOB|nr:glutamine ABC transporter substrate-binding protein [Brevirhabdus pacifica]
MALSGPAPAQQGAGDPVTTPSGPRQELIVATVTRPPFSMELNRMQTGFSLDLWRAIAADQRMRYRVVRVDEFAQMLGMVERAEADLAIANISITAAREQVMDFSHPIFASGLQIMIGVNDTSVSVWSVLMSRDLLLAVVGAFALLFGGGMLMWFFERRAQPYFDHPPRQAMFPAFWWALNLILNGGFEERMPRTPMGRLFGTFMVISSLFIVSLFVAKITAVLTVNAIQSSVSSVNDLYGRSVGTTVGSTSSAYLAGRGLEHRTYIDLATLLKGFEEHEIDAVVFDAPILAHYVNTSGREHGKLVGGVFLSENYGIALPQHSPLIEPVNRSLLRLRENGTYDDLTLKWFGTNRHR